MYSLSDMVSIDIDYIPGLVYGNLKEFIKYRKIDTSYKFADIEEISTKLKHFQYIIIPCHKNNSIIYIIMLSPDSPYGNKSPDFKKLINPLITKFMSQKSNKSLEFIIISEKDLTNHINKAIQDDILRKYTQLVIETYTYDKFKFIVPEHKSVPLVQIPDPDEIDWLCKEFYIDKKKFPKILTSDPMAVWLGLKPGDVVQVTDTSESAGVSTYYQFCIKG
jgi:DNA-directed RNA polymerase subunit H (RpoH/RPB5)